MLDRLLEFLLQGLQLFQPFVVLRAYERGVVLRLGRFHREIGQGFHWLIPLRVEEVQATNIVLETMNVGPQSLTTADGVSIVISVVVSFRIENVRRSYWKSRDEIT